MPGKRWMGENGVEVETVMLHGREVFRVSQDDYFIAYCDSMEDVATFVSPRTLVELPDWGDESGEPGEPDQPGDLGEPGEPRGPGEAREPGEPGEPREPGEPG
ncbi:hypothetical protein HNP84_001644 [Thermocatellispora tengchongensis]|uniref:Uncharacterized protein n=1 Tax=Thermocatellispora tengchongensis TaxID=1073253 RepID=A0A840P213_9ACTN|nr:collagen-like protein [Thermocatellispora tengchongensis]MBB5131931.1 hypothetical protein [Thermocatellispora tengchongensis]